jgi:hypothetical protein
MRRLPDRQERLAALLVVLGAAFVFGPVVWLLERWREAAVRDQASAWGAQWLGERLSTHPYPTAGALLLGVALSSGLVMLVLFTVAKRLAARLAGRARPGQRSTRP